MCVPYKNSLYKDKDLDAVLSSMVMIEGSVNLSTY